MKLLTILMTGLVLFSALYSPQVVYPVLMGQFGADTSSIALLQTAAFLPLTLSPIFYGMMIDRFSPLLVLRIALLFLAGGEVLFALSDSFTLLLCARFFQGLFIPAGMTAVVSYISTSYTPERVQRYIAYYMASTMAGGVAGRVMVGFFSTAYSWRVSFGVLGASILATFFLSMLLRSEGEAGSKDMSGISQMLQNSEYMKPVFTSFFAFLVFSSIMNFYSIRIKELSPDINEFMIGTAYIGSLFGALTAYLTPAFAKAAGSYKRAVFFALCCMMAALALFRVPAVWAVVATLFLFCGAFIVVHASCSGLLNKHVQVSKGAVNGVYFTVYYLGGMIGSSLPGYVYTGYGWSWFLSLLMVSVAFAMLVSLRIRLEP